MNKSGVEYCDRSWNPVTGCLHGCGYCFAAAISRRFASREVNGVTGQKCETGWLHVLEEPVRDHRGHANPYPFGFDPTFHRYRLMGKGSPVSVQKPQVIFVGNMCDLFGEWVPDEWISAVFVACVAAPQHKYLFLTKNPQRYMVLAEKGLLPQGNNFWYGTTITKHDDAFYWDDNRNTFVSMEPIAGPFNENKEDGIIRGKWAIIGAENSNRKGKIVPKREWMQGVVDDCREQGVPVFIKNNAAHIYNAPLIQEYPEGLKCKT